MSKSFERILYIDLDVHHGNGLWMHIFNQDVDNSLAFIFRVWGIKDINN